MNTLDWSSVTIDENDLDLIYNRLLEKETPMTPLQLAETLIENRIKAFKKDSKEDSKKDDQYYRPGKVYSVGDEIEFPLQEGKKGKVEAVRDGNNPALGAFSVITVAFEDGSQKDYVSGLSAHKLNTFDYNSPDQNQLDSKYIYRKFGRQIAKKIAALLYENEDLVRIGNFWFPQALLTEVNPGYLNLAEAVLEMEEGRPLHTEEILEQLEYPMDSNPELTIFSFNYAMQNDPRFGEVGPANVVLWTLKEMQPEDVRKVPMTLKFNQDLLAYESSEENTSGLDFEPIQDELDQKQLEEPLESADSFSVCLSYPHWKAGTIPLIGAVQSIFPTANETDNVCFTFRDKKSGETFLGWVILSKNYICGLKPWYRANGIIPGSIFKVNRTDDPGIIELELIPPRSSKDWIRSFKLDDKNHFSFETFQHKVTTEFDDRMAIYVENAPQLDTFWESNNRKESNITRQIELVFRELAKDNPQGIIHFNEIYSGINLLRRIPPRLLYSILLQEESIQRIDRMYFKLINKDEDANG
ncbi:MAG: hypothetical protein IJI14_20125 [Anaerolineaceae bacterium]|nr:hypothetical protein [Anaerolineaceae bacterium]